MAVARLSTRGRSEGCEGARVFGAGEAGLTAETPRRREFSRDMGHPELEITGKVCLVTGGTSGIGRAIALGFAKAGATVVAGSTNPEKVSAMKNELGGKHDAVRLDVSDEKSVREAVEGTVRKFGRLDA